MELQQKLQQSESQYRNRLNIYMLAAGLLILLIVAGGLWRKNIYKQKSLSLLQKQKQEIDIQKNKVEETLTAGQAFLSSKELADFVSDAKNAKGVAVIVNGKIYVTDTNNHLLRVIDMQTKEVKTVRITNPDKLMVNIKSDKNRKATKSAREIMNEIIEQPEIGVAGDA